MPKLPLVFTFLMIISPCIGQSGMSLEWAQMATGVLYEGVTGVAVDQDENVYHCGTIANTGEMDFTKPSDFNSEAYGYVAKVSSSGSFLWGRSFMEPDQWSVYFQNLNLTSNGDLICTGTFLGKVDFDPSPGVFELNSKGGTASFVLKLSKNGDFMWAKAFEAEVKPNSGNKINGIDLDEDDNIYVAGSFTGGIDFDPGPDVLMSSAGLTSERFGFMVKLDRNGNYVWSYRLENISSEFNGLTLDNNGDIVLAGHYLNELHLSSIYIDITLAPVFNYNYYQIVLKFDKNGEVKWVKRLSTYEWSVEKVICNSSNDVFIVGNFSNSMNFSPGISPIYMSSFSGSMDGFIAKYSSSGDFLWANHMGTSWGDKITACSITKHESIIIGLSKWAPDTAYYGEELIVSGYTDRVILEINASGKLSNVTKMEGGSMTINDFAVSDNNLLFIGGKCSNYEDYPIDFNPSSTSSFGFHEKWSGPFVAKYRVLPNSLEDEILIYPNPTYGEVVIDFGSLKTPVSAFIYDNSGRLIREIELIDNLTWVDLSALSAGMHLIQIVSNQGVKHQKFLKR